jgi:hypothetical protein
MVSVIAGYAEARETSTLLMAVELFWKHFNPVYWIERLQMIS